MRDMIIAHGIEDVVEKLYNQCEKENDKEYCEMLATLVYAFLKHNYFIMRGKSGKHMAFSISLEPSGVLIDADGNKATLVIYYVPNIIMTVVAKLVKNNDKEKWHIEKIDIGSTEKALLLNPHISVLEAKNL